MTTTTVHAPAPPRWERLRAGARRAQAEVSTIEATATSADGTVTATVTPSGELRRLELSDPADGSGRRGLAATVIATIATARHDAHHRALAALLPVLGDEGVAELRALLPLPART